MWEIFDHTAFDFRQLGGVLKNQSLRLQPYLYITPAIFLFLLFIAFPIIMNFINSFYRFSAISSEKIFVGWAHFRNLAGDRVFWRSLLNNAVFAIFSVIVQVGLGMILAAVLQRGLSVGQKVFRTIFFLPMVMSVVSVGLLWSFIYDPILGSLNSLLALVGVPPKGWLGDPNMVIWAVILTACWQYTGFNMVMLLAGMQGIPEELYEAATIDGSKELQNFRFITIPSIQEVISVVVLITVIGSFKVFDYIWVMTRGGPDHASEVLTTYIYLLGFTTDRMGYSSAVASILFIITFIFAVIRMRTMREDL